MRQIDDDVAERVRLKLADLQGQQTDEAFAALLGCTRPHWWNVKHGRRRASYALVKRAAVRFPELRLVMIGDWMAEPPEAQVAS